MTQPAAAEPARFRPQGQDQLAPSGAASRIAANLAALRTLRAIQAAHRPATGAEQEILARWSAWGAVPQLFDDGHAEYAEQRDELRSLVSDAEYAAARRTTINAHYTDAAIARVIWDGAVSAGFGGGHVLEPGCGSGNFIGLAPPGAEMLGIELDPVTAAIAAALYPDAEIRCESFADTRLPEGRFNLVIGNVPFSAAKLHDPRHNRGSHSMHNHFIIKSLHLTRPGGLAAVLTSRYTLDAQDSAAREEMAALGELVTAVRLPAGAHRKAAGTNAVTDLLIFRRHEPGTAPADAPDWTRVTEMTLPGGTAPVNRYFQANPGHVLGTLEVGHSQYRDHDLTVRPAGPLDGIASQLAVLLTPRPAVTVPPVITSKDADRFEGTLRADGCGAFSVLRDGIWEPWPCPATQAGELTALIGLRDDVTGLLDAETASAEDTPDITGRRARLNRSYDTYVRRYGPVNRTSWRRTGRTDEAGQDILAQQPPPQGRFGEDPYSPAVYALEDFDPETGRAAKAAIFTQRVITARRPPASAASPADAVAICADLTGEVELDGIAQLLGSASPQEARAALGELVYDEPGTGRLVPAAEYLSGKVRHKLTQAEQAAGTDPRYAANADALRQVLPPDLGPGEIDARLGAAWITPEIVQQGLRVILDDWTIRVRKGHGSTWLVEGNKKSVLATEVWGTEEKDAITLASCLLEQRPIRVTPEQSESDDPPQLREQRRIKAAAATLTARAKADELNRRFADWLWEDTERSATLARAYNDAFNSLVVRSYDGARLSLPGLSSWFRQMVRPHQSAAVARIISEPAVLLAHEVGAGKTAEMAMGAMELRRLGLCAKPAIVVPNHMLEQFQREFLQLYPHARVLAAGIRDLRKERRKGFIARIATGNWDAVIMTQSAFERIPMSAPEQERYIDGQMAGYREWLDKAVEAQENKRLIKRMETRMLQREERLKRKLNRSRDAGISWEQTGIDYLFVDEAHYYKNLDTRSSNQELDIDGSIRASDLEMKLDYLRSRHGRRVVTFATATPIANSIIEAYVMCRYLRPDLLQDAGIHDVDAWIGTFAETSTDVEVSPEGGLQVRERVARFRNVPELLLMWWVPADVKTADDLKLPVPDLAGGKAEVEAVPSSSELRQFMTELASRANDVRAHRVLPAEDNMLKISSDGRAAALDPRLAGLPAPDLGKLDVAAARIAKIWLENRDRTYLGRDGEPHEIPGALQIVFCDLGVPGGNSRWSAYEYLRDQLAGYGLDPAQVRFTQDATTDKAKADLFAAARSGKVAVLMGSTQGMGVGVNVQDRAIALHHIDCPWRPADVAQREGRILRQRNQNPQVQIIRYVTEGSFDAYMWQTVTRKAKFIAQVMQGKVNGREIEDIGDVQALSYSEVTALATGDMRILAKAKADADVQKLERLEASWQRSQHHLKYKARNLREETETRRRAAADLDAARKQRTDTRGDAFAMVIDGQSFTKRTEAAARLRDLLHAEVAAVKKRERGVLSAKTAALGGFTIELGAMLGPGGQFLAFARFPRLPLMSVRVAEAELDLIPGKPPVGIIARLENKLADLDAEYQRALDGIARTEAEAERAIAAFGAPFAKAADLSRARAEAERLAEELSGVRQPGDHASRTAGDPDASTTGQDNPQADEDAEDAAAGPHRSPSSRQPAADSQAGAAPPVTADAGEPIPLAPGPDPGSPDTSGQAGRTAAQAGQSGGQNPAAAGQPASNPHPEADAAASAGETTGPPAAETAPDGHYEILIDGHDQVYQAWPATGDGLAAAHQAARTRSAVSGHPWIIQHSPQHSYTPVVLATYTGGEATPGDAQRRGSSGARPGSGSQPEPVLTSAGAGADRPLPPPGPGSPRARRDQAAASAGQPAQGPTAAGPAAAGPDTGQAIRDADLHPVGEAKEPAAASTAIPAPGIASQRSALPAPDLADLPPEPEVPPRDLVSSWSGGSMTGYMAAQNRRAAWQHAAEAGRLQQQGASHSDIMAKLAAAESTAYPEDRPFHAARLDAYAAAHGLRGWYRTTLTARSAWDPPDGHHVVVNLIRTLADGNHGRYYASQPLTVPGSGYHVIDRDTGQAAAEFATAEEVGAWIRDAEDEEPALLASSIPAGRPAAAPQAAQPAQVQGPAAENGTPDGRPAAETDGSGQPRPAIVIRAVTVDGRRRQEVTAGGTPGGYLRWSGDVLRQYGPDGAHIASLYRSDGKITPVGTVYTWRAYMTGSDDEVAARAPLEEAVRAVLAARALQQRDTPGAAAAPAAQRDSGTAEADQQRDEQAAPAPAAGPLAARIRVDTSGPVPVISGTDYKQDPAALREALREHGFTWRKPRKVWEYTRRGGDAAADVAAVRDVIRQLDADGSGTAKAFPPTAQQQAILDACAQGSNVAVQALAGTGKTSTLVLAARQLMDRAPEARVIYTAFNRAIVEDARGRFGRNVTPMTMHSMARQALLGTSYAAKISGDSKGARWPEQWAQVLGIPPLTRAAGGPAAAENVARLVMATIKKFRESADDTPGRQHLPGQLIAAPGNPLAAAVLGYAETAWADITSTANAARLVGGQALRVDHDDYLKVWALCGPRIDADVIFFDEAQDVSPVMRKVIVDQPAQVIIVGDSQQSIYGFRGAVDALKDWPADITLPLTQSFRFGPAAAEFGNLFLRSLGSPLQLEGSPARDTVLGQAAEPDAILCRTNATAVAEVFTGLEAGKRTALAGGGAAISEIAKAARDLQSGKGTTHPELSRFADWDEVRQYAQTDEDGQALLVFVRLVDRHGPDGLIDMIGRLTPEDDSKNPPQLTISTAHKSKGREWDAVRIAGDFRGPVTDPETGETTWPSPEERRLAYVTATRARTLLETGSLAWIYDYPLPGDPDTTAPREQARHAQDAGTHTPAAATTQATATAAPQAGDPTRHTRTAPDPGPAAGPAQPSAQTEPDTAPLFNYDLAGELRRLRGFAGWLTRTAVPLPAAGDPEPGTGSAATCDTRGIEITVTAPGTSRHGLVTWEQAASWIDNGVTPARLGILITADRLASFCRTNRGQLIAAGTVPAEAAARELDQIRDTAVAMIVDGALRTRGAAAPIPPPRPGDPAWYTAKMITRPERGAGKPENKALDRLVTLRAMIREPQPATPAEIRAAIRRGIWHGLPGLAGALDNPAAMRTWITGQAGRAGDGSYDRSGELWEQVTQDGLITDRRGDDRAPVLIRWEEIPAWIQPGITEALRDRLLAAAQASRTSFHRTLTAVAHPGAAPAAPSREEDDRTGRELSEAEDAAWAAIDAAPPPTVADLDRARHFYRGPVQDSLFGDSPPDSTPAPGRPQADRSGPPQPVPSARAAGRPAASPDAPQPHPAGQQEPAAARTSPSPAPAPLVPARHDHQDSSRTDGEDASQAGADADTAGETSTAGQQRADASAQAGPAGEDDREPAQAPPNNSDLAIALHSASAYTLYQFLSSGDTTHTHHGSHGWRSDGLPDARAAQDITFDRRGIEISLRSPVIRRHGLISWRQVASWIDAGLTPARLGIIAEAGGTWMWIYARREQLIAAGKDGIDQAISELRQISGDAVEEVLRAAVAAHGADAPVPAARRGKPAHRTMVRLTRPDPSATAAENAALARAAELKEAIRGTQPCTPADVKDAARWWIGDDLPEYARALASPEAMRTWIRRQASGPASRPGKGHWDSGLRRQYGAGPEGLRISKGSDSRDAPRILWEEIPAYLLPGLPAGPRARLDAAARQAPARQRGAADPDSQAAAPLPQPLREAIDAAWAAIDAAPSPSPADLDRARATYRSTAADQEPLTGAPATAGPARHRPPRSSGSRPAHRKPRAAALPASTASRPARPQVVRPASQACSTSPEARHPGRPLTAPARASRPSCPPPARSRTRPACRPRLTGCSPPLPRTPQNATGTTANTASSPQTTSATDCGRSPRSRSLTCSVQLPAGGTTFTHPPTLPGRRLAGPAERCGTPPSWRRTGCVSTRPPRTGTGARPCPGPVSPPGSDQDSPRPAATSFSRPARRGCVSPAPATHSAPPAKTASRQQPSRSWKASPPRGSGTCSTRPWPRTSAGQARARQATQPGRRRGSPGWPQRCLPGRHASTSRPATWCAVTSSATPGTSSSRSGWRARLPATATGPRSPASSPARPPGSPPARSPWSSPSPGRQSR